MPSTFPPNLRRLNLSIEDIHILTSIPTKVLELYQQGRFKPTGSDRAVLQRAASLFYNRMKPPAASVYLDELRLRLLRPVLPQEQIDRLKALANYADYHRALQELSALYEDELEAAILARALESGYDPRER